MNTNQPTPEEYANFIRKQTKMEDNRDEYVEFVRRGELLEAYLNPAHTDITDEEIVKFISAEDDIEVILDADQKLRQNRIFPKKNPECYQNTKLDEKSATYYERSRDSWYPRMHQTRIDYRFIEDHRLAFRMLNTAIAYASSKSQLFDCYYRRSALYMLLLDQDAAQESMNAAHNSLETPTQSARKKIPTNLNRQRSSPRWILRTRCNMRKMNPELAKSGLLQRSLHDPALQMDFSWQAQKHRIFSTRNWNAGHIVAVDVSLCTTLAVEAVHTRCGHCFLEMKFQLQPCRSCCSTMYCSDNCQKADQPVHKYECRMSEFLINHPDLRLIVRLLITSITKTSLAQKCLGYLKKYGYTGIWNEFNFFAIIANEKELPYMHALRMIGALISHTQLKETTIRHSLALTRRAVYLYRVLKHCTTFVKDFFDTADLRGFLYKIILDIMPLTTLFGDRPHCIPSSVRFTSERQPTQAATMCLFPLYCTLRHSCTPNTVAVPIATDKLVLYTIRPLDIGEEVTVDRTHGFYARDDSAEANDPKLYAAAHVEELWRCFRTVCRCSSKNAAKLPFPNQWSVSKNLPSTWRPGEMSNLFVRETADVEEYFRQLAKYLTTHDSSYPCVELDRAQKCLELCVLRLFGPNIHNDFSIDANSDVHFDEAWTLNKMQNMALSANAGDIISLSSSTSGQAMRWWNFCLCMVRIWVRTKRQLERSRRGAIPEIAQPTVETQQTTNV